MNRLSRLRSSLIASLAMVLALACGAAFAASEASDALLTGVPDRKVIGFSEDGRYFAFEVFGFEPIADAPFAEIYVLDTATNEMVGGSPFRRQPWTAETRSQNELPAGIPAGELLERVRNETQSLAMSAIAELGIAGEVDRTAWRFLVSNTLTEIARDAEFVLEVGFPLPTHGLVLELEEFDAPLQDTERCVAMAGPYAGIALALMDEGGDLLDRWRDETIPWHRFCPVAYRIRDVIIFNAVEPNVLVVILTVSWPSHEGNETRYTAVALHLP